jgi:hypothetical protein
MDDTDNFVSRLQWNGNQRRHVFLIDRARFISIVQRNILNGGWGLELVDPPGNASSVRIASHVFDHFGTKIAFHLNLLLISSWVVQEEGKLINMQ